MSWILKPQALKRGTQIAYVPTHAAGIGIQHPDVEFGFVSSLKGDTVFCRYWWKYIFWFSPGITEIRTYNYSGRTPVLRTTTNSEGTPIARLQLYNYVNKNFVEDAIKKNIEPYE